MGLLDYWTSTEYIEFTTCTKILSQSYTCNGYVPYPGLFILIVFQCNFEVQLEIAFMFSPH